MPAKPPVRGKVGRVGAYAHPLFAVRAVIMAALIKSH